MLYPMGCSFCERFALSCTRCDSTAGQNTCAELPSVPVMGWSVLARNSHRGNSLTIWTWKLPPWIQLQPESPLDLPVCLDDSLFLITEANLTPENTEATVYLGDPLCLTVFKHPALQGYDWASLRSWGFRPVILIKGCFNSSQDTDTPLSRGIEALGFWAFLPAWRVLPTTQNLCVVHTSSSWDFLHRTSRDSFAPTPESFYRVSFLPPLGARASLKLVRFPWHWHCPEILSSL